MAATMAVDPILEVLTGLIGRLESAPQQDVVNRLRDSVLRPLEALRGRTLSGPQPGADDASDQLWELAQTVTALSVANPDVPELAEACAALQHLVVEPDRRAALAALMSQLPTRIRVMSNGPYLVSNPTAVRDWLGDALPVTPQMALCRCGGSAIKPYCDGTHAKNGFTDGKDPKRVPDHLDRYSGQQVDILDNRGLCQHSGYCTDRLAAVFHAHDEPFVTASGGRMDEIIRAVRDCPSGALSYAIDGVEARDQVDQHHRRPPDIEITKDGPYRITGAIPLDDDAGAGVARNEGASREHYALCRCGHSQNKPFCSGAHYYVEFHDPVADPGRAQTIFEWAGGLPTLTRMTRIFYEKYVPDDPLLGPLFATMSPDHPQRVAKWLAEVFGGPTLYSADYGGYPRMLSQHLGKCLTEDQRARWVALLLQSAGEAGLPNDAEFRSAFGAYIEWGSRLAVENSQTAAKPPEHMPMPRWDWNTAAGSPGSRISALAPPPKEDVTMPDLPAAGEPVTFEANIKGFFRERDQRSMSSAFDLWSYDDVSHHADAILARLRDGSMPCDGAWPEDRTDVFERWIESGKAP